MLLNEGVERAVDFSYLQVEDMRDLGFGPEEAERASAWAVRYRRSQVRLTPPLLQLHILLLLLLQFF